MAVKNGTTEINGPWGKNHKGLMIGHNFFSLSSYTYVFAAVRKVHPVFVFSVFKCEKTNGADSFFPPK